MVKYGNTGAKEKTLYTGNKNITCQGGRNKSTVFSINCIILLKKYLFEVSMII